MRRHGTDAVSLVFGILFVAISVWWVVDRYVFVDLDLPHVGWIAAGALILLGLVGVVASFRGDRPAPGSQAGSTEAALAGPDEPIAQDTLAGYRPDPSGDTPPQ